MFAYTGFNFANMAHPLSIKFIESICMRFLLPSIQQPSCQRVPPFVVFYGKQDLCADRRFYLRCDFKKGVKQFTKLRENNL